MWLGRRATERKREWYSETSTTFPPPASCYNHDITPNDDVKIHKAKSRRIVCCLLGATVFAAQEFFERRVSDLFFLDDPLSLTHKQ